MAIQNKFGPLWQENIGKFAKQPKLAILNQFGPLPSENIGKVAVSQSSLSFQQMYSASLCSHVNNIYNKLAELQRQLQHCDPHMNTRDTIQIEVPDFDPDIDDISPTTIDQESNNPVTQGSIMPTPKSAEKVIKHTTPAPSLHDTNTQEVDWPDAIPVEILSQSNQQNDQNIAIPSTRRNSEPVKIPQLEENSDEEQYQDLDIYLLHHNTFEASQRIC